MGFIRQTVLRPPTARRRGQFNTATVVEALEDRRFLSATTGVVIPSPPIIPLPLDARVGSISGAKVSSVGINATTGIPFYGPVAQIAGLTAGNTYQLSATINWGDGSPVSSGHFFKNADNSYYVSGWHDFQSAGKFAVTVTITASPGTVIGPIPLAKASSASTIAAPVSLIVGMVTDTATVTQGTTPVPGKGVSLHLTAGQAFSGSVGSFVYINAIGAPYQLHASINWGDGTITSGSIVVDSTLGAGGYSVKGSHTYAVGGAYSITTAVTLSAPGPILESVPLAASSGGSSATIAPLPPFVLISIIKSTADVAVNPKSGPGSISIVNGVLTILGTSGDDTITVRQTPPTYPIVPLRLCRGTPGSSPSACRASS